jgi:hypothetical protein
MNRLSAWGRTWVGALSACLLAVLVLGPTLDAVICGDDAVAASVATAIGRPAAGRAPNDHPAEPAGLCTHGHCHPVLSEAPATPPVIAVGPADRQAYDVVLGSAPTSDRHFELIRPPRV